MKTKEDMPEEVRKEYDEILRWINTDGPTLSLLYDLDLLPEQLEFGTRPWIEMVTIATHMKTSYQNGLNDGKSGKVPTQSAHP